MIARKLKEYLDAHGADYITVHHLPAYRARDVAASAHVSDHQMAKTVMVRLDGRLAMAVLPADETVDLELLKANAEAESVELARETDFRNACPMCELGAMPPFGNLFGMDTLVADDLCENSQIAFNAGTHTDLVRMPYEEYEHLVHPRVLRMSRPA